MASVYEVEHEALGVRRALKVFCANEGRDAENLRRRFLAEGRLLARFDHPGLVKAYDLGVDEATGRPYLAMDLILGADGKPRTLADIQKAQEADEDKLAGIKFDEELGKKIAYAKMQAKYLKAKSKIINNMLEEVEEARKGLKEILEFYKITQLAVE